MGTYTRFDEAMRSGLEDPGAGRMNAGTPCPNCGRHSADLTAREHTASGCFIGMLVGVLQDREVPITSEQVAAFEDVDGLWDRYGGPAADELEHYARA